MQPHKADVENSFRWCENLAKSHYENFPVGSLLVPSDKRKYVHSIYAFARTADDIADSGKIGESEKLQHLNTLHTDLLKACAGDFTSVTSENKNFLISLYETTRHLKIPVIEFENLLKAFKQDSVKQRYDKFDELIEYSRYSANPIGHLVLYVFGYNEKKNADIFRYSDNICTGLQLINFWQDVSRDIQINRIYIPKELFIKYRYSEEELFDRAENDNFRRMMKELTERTRNIFSDGYEITRQVSGRLKLELKATYHGGNEILNKIERNKYNVLSQRPSLSKGEKLKLLLKTVF